MERHRKKAVKGSLLLNVLLFPQSKEVFAPSMLGILGPSGYLLGMVEAGSGAGEQGGIQLYNFLDS